MDEESINSDSSETVYGTQDEHHVMSEKVQSLAATVYQEFERMIKKYDEEVVKELMPLVVGILETMDLSYADKQESEVELELLRDDNEQLLTQYEREKQLRRASEQKYLEVEDTIEAEKKDMCSKVESLESIVRMLELKSRNASDHVSRLEEKEGEMKKEYAKLHERYTELFKSHMDYMERAKLIMGTDRIADLAYSPRTLSKGGMILPIMKPINIIMGSGETPTFNDASALSYDITTPDISHDSNFSLKMELESRETDYVVTEKLDKGQVTDSIDRKEISTGTRVQKNNHATESTNQRVDTGKTDQSRTASSSTEPNSQSETVSQTVPILINQVKDINAYNDSTNYSIPNDKVGNILLKPAPVDSTLTVTERSVLPVKPVIVSTNDFHQSTVTNALVKPNITRIENVKNIDIFGQSLGYQLELSLKVDRASIATPDAESKQLYMRAMRNNDSLFDELNTDIMEEADFNQDVTGKEVQPGDYASSDEQDDDDDEKDLDAANDNFFGMGKEVENLIQENTELLATKNALNIVKDDLIAKVDDLMSEQEILREDIQSLQMVKSRLNLRITQLEEDLKRAREELDKKAHAAQGEDEDDVPMAQRKRFTRVEMARVLMERNQYKERLMELQEAVRWTEMIRASREHPELVPKKKSSIWGFFSSLVIADEEDEPPPSRKKNFPAAQIV